MQRARSCGCGTRRPVAVAWLALCAAAGAAVAHGPLADVQVNPLSANIQNETTIVSFQQCAAAGDPAPKEVVLVAYNDPNQAPNGLSLDRSVDGGLTFPQHIVPGFANVGDPVLALGPLMGPPPDPAPCGDPGDPLPPPLPVHLVFLLTAGGVRHIGVSTSLDGGQTWGAAVNLSAGLGDFHDKPWIDVDLETGTPYVCWTQQAGLGRVFLSGGAYAQVPVGDPGSGYCQVQVDTALDAIHLVWYQNPGPSKVPAIIYRQCAIAGPLCLPPVVVDRHVHPIGVKNDVCLARAIKGPIEADPPLPTFTIHANAPGGVKVYLVAWHDSRFGGADVVVRRSTDGGLTWGPAARRANNVAAGDQFMPGIFARGTAKLQWYDRREDPDNEDIRLWGALSRNGGLSWKNAPISDVLFPPVVPLAGNRKCYMGDYNGVTLGNVEGVPHFLHAWGDNRGGDPDVFFDLQDVSPPGDPDDPDDPPPGLLLLAQTPSFSLRPAGPSSLPTVGAPFHPADLLRRTGGGAAVGIPCANLGLTADGCDDGTDGDLDDLAGVSYGDDFQPLPNQPVLAFSVEPGAQGVPASAVALQAGCSPAEPQADEFAAPVDGQNLQVFDGDGIACSGSSAPGLGLVETAASPPVSDDLDALTGRDTTSVAPAGLPVEPVYLTLAAGSPSLAGLVVTAGHILRTSGGAPPTVFAAPAGLGLVASDRIADFCLREDGDGVFDAGDLLFFTLAPGSPSLAALGVTAADVLAPDVVGGAVGPPVVVASHEDLGLLATDVLDALKCELPWLNDVELTGSAPPTLTGVTGGGPAGATIALDRVLRGPAGTVGDTWLWIDPIAGISARWVGEPGDECIGLPSGFAVDPVVDCSGPDVRGLHLTVPLPVGTSPAARDLEVTCLAPGSYTLAVSGGLRALDPPGAQDLDPGNDFFTTTIDVMCLASGSCPPGGLCFHTVTPCRVLDTRQPGQGPPLSSGMARILTIAGTCSVPASAKAVSINITAVGPTGAGHLTLYAGDAMPPPTSTLNFSAGQTRANNAVLPLATNGSGTLAVLPVISGNGQVHLIVDVTGYLE